MVGRVVIFLVMITINDDSLLHDYDTIVQALVNGIRLVLGRVGTIKIGDRYVEYPYVLPQEAESVPVIPLLSPTPYDDYAATIEGFAILGQASDVINHRIDAIYADMGGTELVMGSMRTLGYILNIGRLHIEFQKEIENSRGIIDA